jgi:hypothetical protein
MFDSLEKAGSSPGPAKKVGNVVSGKPSPSSREVSATGEK